MNQSKINALDLSTNPTHTPYIELTSVVIQQGGELQKITIELQQLRKQSENADRLANAFDMLYKIRIISLISVPIVFTFMCGVYLFVFARDNDLVITTTKFLFGGSTIGLLFEAFWLPNKHKEFDKNISKIKENQESTTRRINDIESKHNQLSEQITTVKAQPVATKKSKATVKK